MALFPHRLKRTDVYADVTYGRGVDLARASGQPVEDPVGRRIGWVETTCIEGVYQTLMLEYENRGTEMLTRDNEADALRDHDALLAKLKLLL